MYQRSRRHPELFRPGSGSIWWAFLPNPAGGRKLRESTGHPDEEAAHCWYLTRIRAGATGALPTPSKKDRVLIDALDERLKWIKAGRKHEDPTRKKLATATIDFYEKKSKPILAVLGPRRLLSKIGHEEIRGYIATRSESVKGTTIAKELTTLSMAWRLARKDGVDVPPFEDIVPEDFAATYVAKTRWLPEPEVDALLEVLAPKRAAVVAFIVATGATYPSEVENFRPELHLRGTTVHILGTKRETRDRFVTVPPYAVRLLRLAVHELEAGEGFERWTNIRGDLHDAARLLSMCAPCRTASLAWARHEEGAVKRLEDAKPCKACKRTPEFAPLCPTDLRRTFAQWLVRSGVPYELAYPMMGHSSDAMLKRIYGRRDGGALAKLVALALKRAPKNARG